MRIAKAFPPREVQTSPEREKRIENRPQIPSQSKVKAGKRRRNPFFFLFFVSRLERCSQCTAIRTQTLDQLWLAQQFPECRCHGVDPTQLTGDSRSTRSFQGRQTCIDSQTYSGIPSGSRVPPGKHHTGEIPAGGPFSLKLKHLLF